MQTNELNAKIFELKSPMPMFDWANFIEDAWDLIDEMPATVAVIRSCAGDYHCHVFALDGGKDHEGQGETAAIAICRCWLAWMGVES